MSFKRLLSAERLAVPIDSDLVPIGMSSVRASGDGYANVTAEATGRRLAVRLLG